MDDRSNIFLQGNTPATKKNLPLAIASFACANLVLLGLFAGQLSLYLIALYLLFPAAIICGHLSRRRFRNEPEKWAGQGMATYGLVVGYFGLFLSVVAVILLLRGYVPGGGA